MLNVVFHLLNMFMSLFLGEVISLKQVLTLSFECTFKKSLGPIPLFESLNDRRHFFPFYKLE